MTKLTQDQFIKRIEVLFQDQFDYSLLTYKDAHTNVDLICKKCKKIESKAPSVWYRGFGCLNCQDKSDNPKKITKEQFIERSKLIHGEKYDYSKIVFEDMYLEVEIICSIHGIFKQKPSIHLYAKSNCPECNISKGEEQIAIWLNQNNIKYNFQHQIKIENSYHYFDFYLPDNNLIIEFNGRQHYEPIKFFGGQEGFINLIKRDEIKKEYCILNKIDLLIVSYNEGIDKSLRQKLCLKY